MQYELKAKRSLMWGDNMRFTLNTPISSVPTNGWPLLLFLHGFNSGDDESYEQWLEENWNAHIRRVPALRRCIVATPICPQKRWWVPESVVALTNEISGTRELQVDSTRLYIMGYSMGAYCTWSILSQYPSLFAAAVPISGGGRPNGRTAAVFCGACACTFPLSLPLFVANACHDTRSDFTAGDLQAVTTFVWGFHGKNDTVVPFEETVRNLEMLPRHVARLTLYDGLTHDTTFSTVVLNINIYNWMLSKKRATVANQRMSGTRDTRRSLYI